MADSRNVVPIQATLDLSPNSGPASKEKPNSGADFVRNSAFLPSEETPTQTLEVNASITDLGGGHIGIFANDPPSARRINYANDQHQRPSTARFHEIHSDANFRSTSGFDYSAIQQQLLMQNQMILQMMQRIPTTTEQTTHKRKPSATVTSANEQEHANFSTLLENPATHARPNVPVSLHSNERDLDCDDRTSSMSGHCHEISSDGEDDDTSEHSVGEDVIDLTKVLDDMEHFYSDNNKCSTVVIKRLSDTINRGMRVNLDKGKRKELLNKYFRPENCSNVVVPKVNKSIWHMLPRHAKDKDSQFQVTQMYLCKAMYPLIQLTNMLVKDGYNFTADKAREALTMSNDVFSILQVAFRDITFRRKASLRPSLNTDYQSLCSMETPATEWLFGDNLEDQIKDITDAQRMRKKLTKTSRARPHPYQSQRQQPPATHGTYRQSFATRPGPRDSHNHFQRNFSANKPRSGHQNSGDNRATKGPFLGTHSKRGKKQ